jgi:hypothetical protein
VGAITGVSLIKSKHAHADLHSDHAALASSSKPMRRENRLVIAALFERERSLT